MSRFRGIALVALLGTAACSATTPRAAAAASAGAPRAVSAVPLNAGAKVTWLAPVSNGGSAITGYVVTPYLGATALPARSFASAKTSEPIVGLTNGKTYSFAVAAVNGAGRGPSSARSGATIAGAPGKPGNPHTYIPPENLGQIGVVFAPPANNGAVISRWNATCSSSNGGVTIGGVRHNPAVPIVLLKGLTVGKHYRCTGTATNRRGTGPRSDRTAAFTAP